MPTIRPKFADGEIYHIYNRGVDKREIFGNRKDKFRFIHNLFEFNDIKPARNIFYRFPSQSYEVELRKISETKNDSKDCNPLVEILAFCLMPNHYHLLLTQKKENGITNFMRKLGAGYTVYFNQKYERTGALFQGKFKAVLVKNDAHFLYLPYYIHFNPLKLVDPLWKDGRINNWEAAIKFLETYRWSSFLDYAGQNNFPFVIRKEFLLNFYKDESEYKNESFKWLKELSLRAPTS